MSAKILNCIMIRSLDREAEAGFKENIVILIYNYKLSTSLKIVEPVKLIPCKTATI